MSSMNMLTKNNINTAAAVTGAVVIVAYIIFGDSFSAKQTPKRRARKKGTIPGLSNFGNTCFLNCILQALASCPSFIKWLESITLNTPPILLHTLSKIIGVLNSSWSDGAASAEGVLRALRSHGWVISTEEQDAHELFHALTSTIDEELCLLRQQATSLLNVAWVENSVMSHFNRSVTSHSTPSVTSHSACGVTSHSSLDESIISRVPSSLKHPFAKSALPIESPFKGHLASQLECSVCGHKSADQWSPFESLSVPLPPPSPSPHPPSLGDLLDAFVRPENVCDVICDACTKAGGKPARTQCSKKLTIAKLPECLCLHIQRTIWLDNGRAVKRKDFVSVPDVLNMRPYLYSIHAKEKTLKGGLLGGREPSPASPAHKGEESSSYLGLDHAPLSSQVKGITSKSLGWRSPSLYRLQAVVVHVGDVFSGHFVAYRRGPCRSALGDKWFYTSDAVVREVPVEEVLNADAYMILYQRLCL